MGEKTALERHRMYMGLSREVLAVSGPWAGRRVGPDGLPLFCEAPVEGSICGLLFGHSTGCSIEWDLSARTERATRPA